MGVHGYLRGVIESTERRPASCGGAARCSVALEWTDRGGERKIYIDVLLTVLHFGEAGGVCGDKSGVYAPS